MQSATNDNKRSQQAQALAKLMALAPAARKRVLEQAKALKAQAKS